MSIAPFIAPTALAPLQNWWRRFTSAPASTRSTQTRPHPRAHAVVIQSPADHCGFIGIELSSAAPAGAPKPLRIVRILEAGQAPAQVGRMLISGRMADVCAELDRLAAHEAALH